MECCTIIENVGPNACPLVFNFITHYDCHCHQLLKESYTHRLINNNKKTSYLYRVNIQVAAQRLFPNMKWDYPQHCLFVLWTHYGILYVLTLGLNSLYQFYGYAFILGVFQKQCTPAQDRKIVSEYGKNMPCCIIVLNALVSNDLFFGGLKKQVKRHDNIKRLKFFKS